MAPPGCAEYYKQAVAQIDDLIVLVRGKMTKQQRNGVDALIVVEVHARDAVQRLVDAEIQALGSSPRTRWTPSRRR